MESRFLVLYYMLGAKWGTSASLPLPLLQAAAPNWHRVAEKRCWYQNQNFYCLRWWSGWNENQHTELSCGVSILIKKLHLPVDSVPLWSGRLQAGTTGGKSFLHTHIHPNKFCTSTLPHLPPSKSYTTIMMRPRAALVWERWQFIVSLKKSSFCAKLGGNQPLSRSEYFHRGGRRRSLMSTKTSTFHTWISLVASCFVSLCSTKVCKVPVTAHPPNRLRCEPLTFNHQISIRTNCCIKLDAFLWCDVLGSK